MNEMFFPYAERIEAARNVVTAETINVRDAKVDFEESKVIAKARLQSTCTEKDAESRKNALAALVLSDAQVRTSEGKVLRAESALARAQASLEAALDLRRAAEWGLRRDYIDAMRERNTEQMTVVASILQNRVEDATDHAMDDLPF